MSTITTEERRSGAYRRPESLLLSTSSYVFNVVIFPPPLDFPPPPRFTPEIFRLIRLESRCVQLKVHIRGHEVLRGSNCTFVYP